MDNKQIFEFAEKLVKDVRDNAIRSCDSQLSEKSNSPIAKRWRELVKSGKVEELQKTLIVDCIDDALFFLLKAIDNKELNLNYISKDNRIIKLAEEGLGEMAGSYASKDWIEKFSNERYSDNFSDLDLDF